VVGSRAELGRLLDILLLNGGNLISVSEAFLDVQRDAETLLAAVLIDVRTSRQRRL
jgi:hypothetical protein